MPNTENLRYLMERIWNKSLYHNQRYYIDYSKGRFYRCLAGWDCYLRKFYPVNDWDEIWQNSRDFNGLTQSEATLLFSQRTNKKIHLSTLISLEEGRRLNCDQFNITSINYDLPFCSIISSGRTEEKIKEFFNGEQLFTAKRY